MYQIEGIQEDLNRAGYWRQKREHAESMELLALGEIHDKRRGALLNARTLTIKDNVIAKRFRVSDRDFTGFYCVPLPVTVTPLSEEDNGRIYNRKLIIILQIDPRGVYQYSAFVTWDDVRVSTLDRALFDRALMDAFPGPIRNEGSTLDKFTDSDLLRSLYEFAVSYLEDWARKQSESIESLLLRQTRAKSG